MRRSKNRNSLWAGADVHRASRRGCCLHLATAVTAARLLPLSCSHPGHSRVRHPHTLLWSLPEWDPLREQHPPGCGRTLPTAPRAGRFLPFILLWMWNRARAGAQRLAPAHTGNLRHRWHTACLSCLPAPGFRTPFLLPQQQPGSLGARPPVTTQLANWSQRGTGRGGGAAGRRQEEGGGQRSHTRASFPLRKPK